LLTDSLESHINEIDPSLFETVLQLEIIQRFQPPQPEDSLMHDDWVSTCRAEGDTIAVGSYDNRIHLWNNQGEHLTTLPGHSGPVRSIIWISSDEGHHHFVSGSHDQTILIWNYDQNTNSVKSLKTLKGHTGTVETLARHPTLDYFASGSWDKTIRLWGINDEQDSVQESRVTINAHLENVSSLVWRESNCLVSCSWDKRIQLWNIDRLESTQTIKSNKAILSIDVSPISGLIVAGFADRFIRLYDSRKQEGYVLRSTYSSHNGWVPSVMWSRQSEYLFLSGSYDRLVKLWDCRSMKSPLYDLHGHGDRVLCVDWSRNKLLLSGSADNSLKMFSFI